MFSELFAFLVNVILNIVLIPHFGIVGAALSTAVGFLCGASYLFTISRKEIKIEYHVKEFSIIVITALVFLIVGKELDSFFIDIILILLYLLTLHFFTKIKLNRIFRIA
jgi:O-antigen/teichoic acid export membrane protein